MTKQRIQRLREKLDERKLDALFIVSPETASPVNRRYLSGFTGTSAYLLVTQNDAVLATDFRYWEQVGRQSPDFELVKMTQGDLGTWLAPVLERIQPATLAFEAGNATFAFHTTLKESLKKLRPALRPRLVPTLDLVEGLRIVKDEEELQIITRAVEIADQAYMEVSAGLEPGITEREIAWRLEKSMREQGAESTSFDIIVAAGPNAAMPHHRPTDRPVEKDEPIIIDMGARLQGYCSDLSRTTFLGKPDDTYRRVYDVVLGAQETAIAAVQSDMTGHDADRLARLEESLSSQAQLLDVAKAFLFGDRPAADRTLAWLRREARSEPRSVSALRGFLHHRFDISVIEDGGAFVNLVADNDNMETDLIESAFAGDELLLVA